MARVKLTSRKSSKKRLPVATVPKKNSQKIKRCNLKASVQNSVIVKETKEEVIAEISSSTMPSETTSPWAFISSSTADDTSFTEGFTDNIENLPINAGKWLLFCDKNDKCASVGMSHHDYAWQVAKALVKDFKNTGIISAKCSTMSEMENDYDDTVPQGVVCCYTANYKDKLDVKKAAEAIRKVYPYPTNMYYKAEKDSLCGVYNHYGDRPVTMYKHTVDNSFYERGISTNYKWQRVDFVNEDFIVNEATMPSRVTNHQWLYISSPSDNSEEFKIGTADYMELLPETAGKWLLFHTANDVCPIEGMSHHDYAWKCIRPLVTDFKNTGIIAAKCSTSGSSSFRNLNKGVICCYTADYTDKANVRQAAEAIRACYLYSYPMYYKTEDDTDAGIYNEHGDRLITIYRHNPDNKMFERTDENRRDWKLFEL